MTTLETEEDVANHPLLASEEPSHAQSWTAPPETIEPASPRSPRTPVKDLFAQEETIRPRLLLSSSSITQSSPTSPDPQHQSFSSPPRRMKPKKTTFVEPELSSDAEKTEFKPFSAQSVIHSFFRESKLSKRTKAMDMPPIDPEEVLSPATNDPLMNPEPTTDLEAAPIAAPMGKKKIRWSRYIPWVWTFAMCFILFGFLPWGAYTLNQEGSETYVQAWFIAGIFVCVAVPISIWDVAQHLRHWYDPPLQKCIVRIIWMVPVYAIDSWLALRFININIYLDAARECYEAYVIYNFYLYLLIYLRKNPEFDTTLHLRKPQPHLWPIHFIRPWPMGQTFLNECTKGVVNYIVIKPLTTIAAFFLELTDAYDEGELRYDKGYAYIALISSISQGWAIYCLVLFYLAFKEDLKNIKPLYKFITIKAVVFLSFWQSVFIAFLVYIGVIQDDPRWQQYNSENVALGLQDFLVCIEMFIAAIVHHFVFSFDMYVRDKRFKNRLTHRQQFWHIFDVSDLRAQLKEMVTGSSSPANPRDSPGQPGTPHEQKPEDDVDTMPMIPPSSQPPSVVV